jgi:hypothetical protein
VPLISTEFLVISEREGTTTGSRCRNRLRDCNAPQDRAVRSIICNRLFIFSYLIFEDLEVWILDGEEVESSQSIYR